MRKIKGLRWYMIALVTLGTVLGYLTRNTRGGGRADADGRVTHLDSTVLLYHCSLFRCLHRHAACRGLRPRYSRDQNRLCLLCYRLGDILRLNRAGRQLGRPGAGSRRSRRSGSRDDPCRAESQF